MADTGDHRSARPIDEAAAFPRPEIDSVCTVDERVAEAGESNRCGAVALRSPLNLYFHLRHVREFRDGVPSWQG